MHLNLKFLESQEN